MKIFLASIILFLFLSACASVKPLEKEYLADKIMQFDADKEELTWELHAFPSREGAAGGYGGPGGGCGCN